jgi:hypothetical protein
LNLPAPAFMTRKLKCWRPNYHFPLTREALAGAFACTIEFQILADRAKLALHIFSALFQPIRHYAVSGWQLDSQFMWLMPRLPVAFSRLPCATMPFYPF